jgi:hypothetical protein
VAISVLQEVHNENPSGGGSATTIAVTLTVAAGSALHVYVMENANGSGGSITLSDNLGQTYTQSSAVTDASRIARDFYLIGAAAGSTTITATMSLGAFVAGIWVKEIGQCSGYQSGSGQLQLSPGAGTDAVTSNTATPSSQPALVSGFTFGDNNADTTVAGTGFTTGLNTWPLFGAGLVGLSEHLRVTSTSAIAATYTATAGGASNRWKTVVAIFTEGAAAASAVPFTRQQQYILTEEPPPQQRRPRLVVSGPATATQVPFSRAAQQQALQQWIETPAGIVLPRRLVRPTLPVTGAVQWFRSDLAIGVDGSNDLLAWGDSSGAGNNATSVLATSPLWSAAGGINGLPRVSFTTSWFMTGTTNPVPSGAARTCIAVMRSAGGTTGGPFKFRTSAPTFSVLWSSGGANTNVYTDAATNSQAIPTVDYNRTAILEVAWDGNTSHDVTCRLNNGAQTVVHNLGTGTPSDTGASGFQIGVGLNGEFYEWIVLDHVMTPAERTALFDGYLGPRYLVPSEQVAPFSRLAQLGTALRSWDPELAPRFDRRFAPQGIVVAPDSPIPGWNRRVSNLIARQAWEAPDGLPQLPGRPTSNYPAAPSPAARAPRCCRRSRNGSPRWCRSWRAGCFRDSRPSPTTRRWGARGCSRCCGSSASGRRPTRCHPRCGGRASPSPRPQRRWCSRRRCRPSLTSCA